MAQRLFVPASAHLLCLVVLVPGRSAAGQTSSPALTGGASIGPAFQTTSLDGHLGRLGPAASLFLKWSVAPRLALTLEALASRFGVSSDHIHGPCDPTVPFACHRPVGEVSVGGLVSGVQWADSHIAAGGGGSYLVLGGGLYRALRHPTDAGATRVGWTAGVGFVLRPAKPRFALEVRYHQVARWPEERLNLVPLTIAVSW